MQIVSLLSALLEGLFDGGNGGAALLLPDAGCRSHRCRRTSARPEDEDFFSHPPTRFDFSTQTLCFVQSSLGFLLLDIGGTLSKQLLSTVMNRLGKVRGKPLRLGWLSPSLMCVYVESLSQPH